MTIISKKRQGCYCAVISTENLGNEFDYRSRKDRPLGFSSNWYTMSLLLCTRRTVGKVVRNLIIFLAMAVKKLIVTKYICTFSLYVDCFSDIIMIATIRLYFVRSANVPRLLRHFFLPKKYNVDHFCGLNKIQNVKV